MDPTQQPGGKPPEINPKIRKQLLMLRVTVVVTLATLLLATGIMWLVMDSQEREAPLWLLVMPLAVFPLVAVLLYPLVQKNMLRPLRRAALLMASVEPKQMLMRSTGLADYRGLVVTLHDPDVPLEALAADRPRAMITLQAGRRGMPRLGKGIPVTVYADQESPDRFLAVETERHIMWGTLSTRESRRKSWQIMKRAMVVMILVLLALLGVFATLQMELAREADDGLELARASASWPQAQGVVRESRIEEVRVSRGKSSVPGFKAVVAYRYSVAGREYDGRRLHFCYTPSTRRDATRKIVAQFPVGASVAVAYNPEQPSLAVLYPGYDEACAAELERLRTTSMLIALMTGAMVLAMLGVFWYQARRRKAVQERLERWGLP